MNPVAIVNDEHLSGETEHPQSLRYLRPEDQRILVVDDEEVILDLTCPTPTACRCTAPSRDGGPSWPGA